MSVASDGAEYEQAHRVLRAEHGDGGDTGPPAAEVRALRLLHATLAGVRADTLTANGGRGQQILSALVLLRHLREELAAWEPELITAAREAGVSWAALAPALGVTSRQAAERRYLRLRPSATGESTGEARVRAERDKRAGDRAVARWARENSAPLRQLAGQVSALTDLPGPAQQSVHRVQRALADDDPASLLSPLAGAREHLAPSHPALAEQIGSITERTEALRNDTRDRRRPR
ncbi:HSP18 transcriptional regulator [Gandjariella thermophila]|uniref:HSP18 transcriptional regulator n=1 Tax=Gandjariella thermophila TaxID=1931992 RepID=A0A4D4JGS6_9PSEU|nr:HSP18 transcriptional regulator [Gandjariella thermophila]GDY33606.1 hypothetical protein GTS_52390 [Gandjariella thermophila]